MKDVIHERGRVAAVGDHVHVARSVSEGEDSVGGAVLLHTSAVLLVDAAEHVGRESREAILAHANGGAEGKGEFDEALVFAEAITEVLAAVGSPAEFSGGAQ